MAKLAATQLQLDILNCLARGMSTEEVMTACNCSISSVKQTRANKELRVQYAEAMHNAIRGLVPEAIKELKRLITDPTVQDSVKVSAVKQVLEVSRISDIAGAVQQDINITVSYE